MQVPEILRRAWTRAVAWLTSRGGSFWVLGAWVALAVVWLVPFQLTGQPDATVSGIATTWLPFQLAYAALTLTTAVCGFVRFQADLRRYRARPPVERPLPATPSLRIDGSLPQAAAALKRMRFEVTEAPDRVLGSRARLSVLGGSVFHLAIPLLALGLWLHATTFGAISFRLIEGQPASTVAPGITAGQGEWAGLPLAADGLKLESVGPSFFEDVFLFERLDAVLLDERTGQSRWLSLSSPLWLDPFTMVSVQDFGLAPRVQLLEEDGSVAEEITAAMSVFPPGSQDRVFLPENAYIVGMTVLPDYGVVDGRDVSLSYNVREPRFVLTVEKEYPVGQVWARGMVGLDEPLSGAGLDVNIAELRYHGTFRVWRSYGWPVLALAALAMLVGTGARFLYPSHEVAVWEVDGGLGVDVRIDGRPGPVGRSAFAERLAARMSEPADGDAS